MKKHFTIEDVEGVLHLISTNAVERVSQMDMGIVIYLRNGTSLVTVTYDLPGYCANVMEDGELADAPE